MCEKRLATISEIYLILLIIIFKVIKVYYIKSFVLKMKSRVHIAQK